MQYFPNAFPQPMFYVTISDYNSEVWVIHPAPGNPGVISFTPVAPFNMTVPEGAITQEQLNALAPSLKRGARLWAHPNYAKFNRNTLDVSLVFVSIQHQRLDHLGLQ